MRKAGAVLFGLGLVQAARGKSVRPPLALASFLLLFKFGKRLVEARKEELTWALLSLFLFLFWLMCWALISLLFLFKRQAGLPAQVLETLPGSLAAAVGLGFVPSASAPLWIIWLWIRVLRFTLPEVIWIVDFFSHLRAPMRGVWWQ